MSSAVAAASGGITTIAALPDTQPAIDDPALVQLLRTKGEETGSLTILPYGAVTRGCRGEELSEIGLLREAGAVAFTDGSRAIGPARMMRLALSYARGFGARIVQHPEEPSLAGGSATESEQATRLGLPGIPAAAEAIMVARDIRLAELTGGAVHFAHVSTGEALELIRRAKQTGRLRHDVVLNDLILMITAAGGILETAPAARVAASRRFAALMIQAFQT